MDLNLRSNYRYAIACPTSMGVRITPENRMAVHNSNHFYLQATSAESNVLNVSSSLGKECLVLTKFVKGSPIAEFIKSQLRARNIRYEGVEVDQGGPWGYRHQFNIADSGFGLRAPRVWNDRAGEVGRTLSIDEFDVERIFGEEGVGILHISGLIAAMSEDTTRFCLAAAKAAKEHGTLVSFDLNYRATFWKGREEELREAFHQIASVADVLVGNEEDFQLCLGFTGPEAGGKDLSAKISSFQDMIARSVRSIPTPRSSAPLCVRWSAPTSTFGAPSFWPTVSGAWKSPVPSPSWTASAAATASPAACSTASSPVGNPQSACSSAGPAACSLPAA